MPPEPPLSLLGNSWRLREVAAAQPPPGLPAWVGGYLQQRGLADPQAVAAYLRPSLAALRDADPATLADMGAAVARLQRAVAGREAVVIYGDYDVDGVCACSLLMEFLRQLGVPVDFYIPHRRSEGYGPNTAAFAKLGERASLVVTVDCGSSAHAEIALLQQQGVDVIVVDHHQLSGGLPAAVACLNPQRDDCTYGFGGLCATGVAFMLAICLRRSLREAGIFGAGSGPDLRPLLDLVAVATVADMMPLTAINRNLVAAGLQRLRHQPRPGLRALCQVAGLEPQAVDAAAVGFKLAPRLNAAGRMGAAAPAVALMLCTDAAAAATLAQQLDANNTARRSLQRQVEEEALAQVLRLGLDEDAAIVVHDPTWHAGVLGLVASRLVGQYQRPALVIGEGGKGSGRSVGGFDLHAALQQQAAHLLRFGGHRAAAGVTIALPQLQPLRAGLRAAAAAARGAPPYHKVVALDAELRPEELAPPTLAVLQALEPFGQGNPQPLFLARRLQVKSSRPVGSDHLRLSLGNGAAAIGFGMAHLRPQLTTYVDAAFYLETNHFGGRASLQLRLSDLRCSGA